MPHRHTIQLSATQITDRETGRTNPGYVWKRTEEPALSFRDQIKGLATTFQAMHANRFRLRHAH